MDWGIANRMARILKPETGRTVMLAVDHGYFLGPTSGSRSLARRSCRSCRTPTR